MLTIKKKFLSQPLWSWALYVVTALALGFYTSWAAYGNFWSWPLLFTLAMFAIGVVLAWRRYRHAMSDTQEPLQS